MKDLKRKFYLKKLFHDQFNKQLSTDFQLCVQNHFVMNLFKKQQQKNEMKEIKVFRNNTCKRC